MVRKRLHRLGLVLPCYGRLALRHSCATHLLAEGVSLKEIADHVGHVSLGATQMYAKVDLTGLSKSEIARSLDIGRTSVRRILSSKKS